MSVINRMLQDIDRRNAASIKSSVDHPEARNVSPRRTERKFSGLIWIFGAAVGLIGIGMLGWKQWRALTPPATSAPQVAAVVNPIPPPVNVPVATITTQPVESTNVQSATPTEPPAAVPVENPATVLSAMLSAPTRATPLISADTLKLSMKLSALLADTPAASDPTKRAAPIASSAPTATATPTLPGKTTITNLPVRQVATDETIATARMMWNDGAHSAALATLREALAAAENSRNQRAIGLLARELARLEVADQRPQVALDLLKRLEGVIGTDADAWALRGNAEQRLALHGDAAASYMAALRIRPNEGKWMLGAAISLAVGGKLDEAQVWVDRAKERDALTPTISAYLKQLGIRVGR